MPSGPTWSQVKRYVSHFWGLIGAQVSLALPCRMFAQVSPEHSHIITYEHNYDKQFPSIKRNLMRINGGVKFCNMNIKRKEKVKKMPEQNAEDFSIWYQHDIFEHYWIYKNTKWSLKAHKWPSSYHRSQHVLEDAFICIHKTSVSWEDINELFMEVKLINSSRCFHVEVSDHEIWSVLREAQEWQGFMQGPVLLPLPQAINKTSGIQINLYFPLLRSGICHQVSWHKWEENHEGMIQKRLNH